MSNDVFVEQGRRAAAGWNAGAPAPAGEAPYAVLMGAFVALVALAAGQRREERRLGPVDLISLGLASNDIARIVARDRVAVWLRRPFTQGAAAQQPRGSGLRRAVGELLTCPHCLSLWVAAALTAGHAWSPGRTRGVAAVFSAHEVARTASLVAERVLPR